MAENGTIEWLGRINCKRCYNSVSNIPLGEGRNVLKDFGWKRKSHRWYCPECAANGKADPWAA